MPYATNDDLPSRVRGHLPPRAQDQWRATFNAAWQTYAADPRREEIAARVAWTAIKRRYVRVGTMWEPKGAPSRRPIMPATVEPGVSHAGGRIGR